jgi:hypothetical protein
MRASGRELARAAPGLLALAVALGAAVGLARGRRYPGEGFPLLLADAVRQELALALAGAALFALLYFAARAALAGRLPGRLGIALAAALAGAPLVAAAGYRLNREAGFRPSELLEPFPLRWNLLLLAAAGAVFVAVLWVLTRAARAERPPRSSLVPVLALAAAVALFHGAVAAALAGRQPTAERPDVLLLLVDALRPDHLGAYGYGRETSPAIDSLAADGILFREAIAQSTFTKSSIASLLTGRFPYQHGVYWGSRTDDPELPGASPPISSRPRSGPWPRPCARPAT